jgi:hypothetical protein
VRPFLFVSPMYEHVNDGGYVFRYRNMCRFNSGVRSTLLTSAPGSKLLTKQCSFSFATHYYKSSGTIGASSTSSLSCRQFTHAYLISYRPHVHFHCDVNFDPFTYLRENNKTYGLFLSCPAHQILSLTPLNSGFTLSMYDWRPTLPSLWSAVKGLHVASPSHPFDSRMQPASPFSLTDFISAHPEYVAPNNAMGFVSDDGGADYNLCICRSFSLTLHGHER